MYYEYFMPNQREVAVALGVNQSTVSLALRGSPRVEKKLREKICETAKEMGYQSNAAVDAVMCRIRAGKRMNDKGVIALLVDAPSEEKWHEVDTYRIFHQGACQRGLELGYRIESFFLQNPNTNREKIDRILTARGITGIILAPPYHGNRSLKLHWERYAAIGIGFGWEEQELNRVVYDSLYNFTTAFNELRKSGYKRIGVVIHKSLGTGVRRGVKWYTAYLDCQNNIPKKEQIPVFLIDSPADRELTTANMEKSIQNDFYNWFSKWSPDTLLTITGEEMKWLSEMNLDVPRDLGLACLALSHDSRYAGIYEKSDIVGATATELVSAQIAHNELGLPTHRKTTMIEGIWVNGITIRNQNAG